VHLISARILHFKFNFLEAISLKGYLGVLRGDLSDESRGESKFVGWLGPIALVGVAY